MLLAPLRAIADPASYGDAPRRSDAWILGFIAYLGLLFAVAATAALRLRLAPAIDETVDWAARSIPTLTFRQGEVTSATAGAARFEPPRFKDAAFLIDTSRVAAVTADELEARKAVAFLSKTALYLLARPGRVERQDLSLWNAKEALVLDGEQIRSLGRTFTRVLYPTAFLAAWALFILRKLLAAAAYSLLALLLNAGMKGGLAYRELWRLAAFAQAPAAALEMARLFLPGSFPFFGAITLVVVTAYLWQAILQNRRQPDEAPAAIDE